MLQLQEPFRPHFRTHQAAWTPGGQPRQCQSSPLTFHSISRIRRCLRNMWQLPIVQMWLALRIRMHLREPPCRCILGACSKAAQSWGMQYPTVWCVRMIQSSSFSSFSNFRTILRGLLSASGRQPTEQALARALPVHLQIGHQLCAPACRAAVGKRRRSPCNAR